MEELQFEALESLDLRKRRTVGEIVDGMSRCSFGARMLGEVAATLTRLIQEPEKEKPTLVYDGKSDTPLGKLLLQMVYEKQWFRVLLRPESLPQQNQGTIVVVGDYSDRYEDALYNAERTIFINSQGKAKPGQVSDGYYPDVVFTDPRYIMPVLAATLEERLEGKQVSMGALFKDLRQYEGLATEVVHGAHTFKKMVEDPDCTVFMTLSGAMTIAQLGLVITDMIDLGMVQYISSTGALMAHGLVQGVGLKHYKYNPKFDDASLAQLGINRVTDTLEPETNLDHIEEVIGDVLEAFDGFSPISPRILHKAIGKHLAAHYSSDRAILKSSYEHDVPVIVPAFVDSEIGNDLYVHNVKRDLEKRQNICIDSELDSRHLVDTVIHAKKIGIFTIGGGVPRNFVQNVAPLIEIANKRLDLGLPVRQFVYGARICPDPMFYGHLSGCTYSEGMSWRKMDPQGQFAEVHGDATQVWPFYVRFVMDKIDRGIEERKVA
ncbi:deoxyhypusine synthase family protein [Candidatus Woesearchaeota archaeon]|nr:deoxyhypusine synthase family protein [Candidatus Woesearchaeota archaeon]